MTKYFANPKYYLEFIDQSQSSATCSNVIFWNWISYTCMHSLHWSGVISRVEKAKYARRFVLWKSSEYKKNGHKFCFRGNGTSVFRNLCLHFQKKSPYRFFRQGIISGTFVFLKSATVANKLSGDSRLAYIWLDAYNFVFNYVAVLLKSGRT